MRRAILSAVSAASIFATISGTPAIAQVEGPAPVQVVIRAESKDAATALTPADLKVQINGHDMPVTSLQPLTGVRPARTEVAVLIDDNLRGNFGTQLSELEGFVRSTISPQTAVGIAYMENGRAVFPTGGFSNDPEVAVKAIRLPIGAPGISASPYFCLQDLVKKWQPQPGVAHVVLMITNGIDPYNGSVRPENQTSPYVDSAKRDAARAGVPVYSIYYGRREFSSALGSFSGQSYLSEVAEATGGESFNQGQINPVSLQPYFQKFQKSLQESYLLTFQTTAHRDESLKIKANAKGVKIQAPQTAPLPR